MINCVKLAIEILINDKLLARYNRINPLSEKEKNRASTIKVFTSGSDNDIDLEKDKFRWALMKLQNMRTDFPLSTDKNITTGTLTHKPISKNTHQNIEIISEEKYEEELAKVDKNLSFIKLAHIFLQSQDGGKLIPEAETQINKIHQQLKQKKISFKEAAIEFSDDEYSKNDGGLLGWLSSKDCPAEIFAAAFVTAVDEISEVIQSDFGYHILKVKDKRTLSTNEFIELKNDKNYFEFAREDLSKLYSFLRNKTSIKRKYKLIEKDDKVLIKILQER